MFQALLEEGEDPENYVFDKFEFKNVNYTEKSTEKSSLSPSVEKKISPVIEKKPTSPVKIISKYLIKKPGPKSSKYLSFHFFNIIDS